MVRSKNYKPLGDVFEVRCDSCGSVLEFERSDLQYDFNVGGKALGVISCPECGNNVEVSEPMKHSKEDSLLELEGIVLKFLENYPKCPYGGRMNCFICSVACEIHSLVSDLVSYSRFNKLLTDKIDNDY
jgi:hypothetical protein